MNDLKQKILIAIISGSLVGGGIYLIQDCIVQSQFEKLEKTNIVLQEQLNNLSEEIAEVEALKRSIDFFKARADNRDLIFYLEKLKDQSFFKEYGDGQIWYMAPEELGNIGREAIPYLMKKLDNNDSYETTQVLYALRLASQNKNVTIFTAGEFPTGSGEALPQPKEHEELVKEWKLWFEKYETEFNISNEK